MRATQRTTLRAHVALAQVIGITPDPDNLIVLSIDDDTTQISADPTITARGYNRLSCHKGLKDPELIFTGLSDRVVAPAYSRCLDFELTCDCVSISTDDVDTRPSSSSAAER